MVPENIPKGNRTPTLSRDCEHRCGWWTHEDIVEICPHFWTALFLWKVNQARNCLYSWSKCKIHFKPLSITQSGGNEKQEAPDAYQKGGRHTQARNNPLNNCETQTSAEAGRRTWLNWEDQQQNPEQVFKPSTQDALWLSHQECRQILHWVQQKPKSGSENNNTSYEPTGRDISKRSWYD